MQQGTQAQDTECSMVLWILAQARVLVFKIGEFLHHYIINVCLRIFQWKIPTGISGILTFIFIPFLKNIRNIVNIRKYGCSSTVFGIGISTKNSIGKVKGEYLRKVPSTDCGLLLFISILQIIWCSNWNYAKMMQRIYTYKLSNHSNVFPNHVKMKV